MAEKHVKVTITTATWQFFLQKLWDFIENSQSGILQFVQEGGDYAVKSGGSFWNGSDDLSSGFGSDNDYIVVEPVTAYPGGDKWQAKIKAIDFDDKAVADSSLEVSWLGGYDTSANDFPAGNQTSGELTHIPSYHAMATTDSWYFSCSNSDTYTSDSGTQTYTYLRVAHFDTSAAENGKFAAFYVGGYIPAEPNADTKPVCVFTRLMQSGDGNTFWGDRSSTTSLAPGNYAHNTSGGNVGASIPDWVIDYYHFNPLSRSGNWINTPLYILDENNTTTLGAFGKFSQLWGDYDRTDGAADGSAKYMVSGDIMFRWNTAA